VDDFSSDLNSWDILVGKVVGRWDHANLKIAPHEASPDRFKSGSSLCLEDKSGKRRLVRVLSSRKQGKSWICDCGVLASEEAEALVGSQIWIHRSMRPKLPEGEFYLDEVLGLRVVTESGEELGEIEEVLESPAHNIYVTGAAMIPAHSEFIVKTDWDARVLTVRDVPGLKVGS
jgi:16S rRNA processing protein RimM